jgi:hypothetical protein
MPKFNVKQIRYGKTPERIFYLMQNVIARNPAAFKRDDLPDYVVQAGVAI